MSRLRFCTRASIILACAALLAFVVARPAAAQTGGVRSTGGGGIGGTGLGGGLGSSGLGGGLGGTGLGGTGLGGAGLGGGLGGTGLSGGLGGSNLGGMGLGSSGTIGLGGGSFSGNLSTTGLGFSGISSTSGFSAGGYRSGVGVGVGGSTANAAALDTSAARFAGIASSNLFSSYYANPMAAGMSTTGTATIRFGSPLFTISSTNTGLTGGVGSATAMTGNLSSQYGNATSTGMRPNYAMAEISRSVSPGAVQPRADLQQILARSSSLSRKNSIQVASDASGAIVLRGTVASEHDRLLAEGLIRLSPGVNQVVNELTIAGATPAAGSS